MAMGFKCAAHFHRSMVPLEIHHIYPLGEGGPDTAPNKVSLCANGHSSIHDLLSKMLKDKATWKVRIRYGFRVRRLARQGYEQIMRGREA